MSEEMTDVGGEASVPANEEGNASSEVNWSDLALEGDEAVVDGVETVAVEGDSEVLADSGEQGESPAEGVPQSGETAPSPTPAQAAPQQTVQSAPPQPPQEPPAQPTQTYAEWRGKQLEGLTKFYAFDEETSAKLLTEPEVVLPQLAAKLHMEVVEHVMRSVQSAIPQWMHGYVEQRSREESAEKLFYEANPDLKDPSYRNAVLQMGLAYRQLNPNAPAEEAVKVIGNMVRSSLGLTPATPVQQAPAAPQPTPRVFTPARGGGGGAVQAPSVSNPWAAMAEEFLNES